MRMAFHVWSELGVRCARGLSRWAVSAFLPLFISFILMFWVGMYAVYPSSRFQGASVFNSNQGTPSAVSMITLAFTGDSLDLDYFDDFGVPTVNQGSGMIALNACVFYILYLLFVTINVILQLNLLIARMNSTYARIEDNSIVAWRTNFARMALRLENVNLPQVPFTKPWERRAGVPSDDELGPYTHSTDATLRRLANVCTRQQLEPRATGARVWMRLAPPRRSSTNRATGGFALPPRALSPGQSVLTRCSHESPLFDPLGMAGGAG